MRTALIIALLALVFAQEKINYFSDQDHTEPIDVIIEKFAAQQPEIYRKVFLNFINEKITYWRSTSNEDKVKEQLLFLLTEPFGPL